MKSFLLKKTALVISLAGLLLVNLSCERLLDTQPKEVLDKPQTYRNIFDADAAVLGVYGKFMNLAKQYVVLNELRADLMDVTVNSDEYLKQINNHTVTEDNPYADPRPFYEVILNCNDVLKNFKIMAQENKIKADEYQQRYADIVSVRAWVYLQLCIHFGKVPYVTETIETTADVANLASLPRIPMEQLIPELIKTMEAIPAMYREPYTTSTSLITTVDGYYTPKFFVHKNLLLGDLYLWNNQYLKASQTYKLVLETASRLGYSIDTGEIFFALYKIHYAGTNNNDLVVGYLGGRTNDVNSLADNNTQGWRSMFARAPQDTWFNYEWIWYLPFDKNFNPTNPFVELFSPIGGKYLVKPSQAAMDYWNSQVQFNNMPFDARGRLTWKNVAGQPVIMKYLYNYLEPNSGLPLTNLQEKPGKWFLYRAATLHLHYAEAANRDGRRKLAYALLNRGISVTFDSNPALADQTNKQATFDVSPYNFDARSSTIYPFYRDSWYRNNGIRGRAYVRPVEIKGDSTLAIEDALVQEGALELAYEGIRWADLVRIASRRNDPAFLANKVYDKLKKSGNSNAEAVKNRLMVKENWFLPFKLK